MELSARSFAGHRYRITSFLDEDTTAARPLGVEVGEGCRILSCQERAEPWRLTLGDRVTAGFGIGGGLRALDGTDRLTRDERGLRLW